MVLIDIPWLTDALKKRALRYLLQRYMGHFLAEKLTLEQLSIDLYDGTGCIKNLALDVEGLNEELVFLPFKFTDGCAIGEINCSVPWSSLMTESCSLEINSATFHLNFCSNKDQNDDHLYESSYLSKSMMSSSMQMAEEIASDDKNNDGQFEGLEMMAQLIDSVLRRVKVVATDTTIIMKSAGNSSSSNNNASSMTGTSTSPPSTSKSRQSASSSSGGSSVEFKIKYLRCEEDVPDACIGKDSKCNTPGNIDKLLTMEGVEVGINGRPVSRIGGKHLIKIKANAEKSDLQIFLGSPLFAILTSSELKSFFDVFSTTPEPEMTSPSHGYGSSRYGSNKPMTEEHFFHLEHILQQDAQSVRHQQQYHPHGHPHQRGMPQQQNLLGTSPLDHRWSEPAASDRQFHPLSDSLMFDFETRSSQRSRSQSTTETSASTGNQFSCFIKIPGVYLCLLQKSDQSSLPAPTIPLIQVDFQKINSFLDDIVRDRKHIRLIAFPIHLDITKSSSINVIIGDAMVIEQSSGSSKIPLFWSEASDKHMTAPKYRCEIRPSSSPAVMIEGHETTCLTFDPTIRERLHEYLPDQSQERNANHSLSHGSSSNIMDFELKSKLLKVNLLFPIPDLRDEEELEDVSAGSGLRSEAVMLVAEEVVITTNLNNTKIVLDDLKAILTEKNKDPVLFLEAKRNPVDQIEVTITQGPATVYVNDDQDPESYLSGDMEDSVYYANLSEQDKAATVFLVTKKLINGGGSENESVIGPSDRKNSQTFLNNARTCTNTQIEVNIPSGDVALDQRQLDLIYNRFGNDLVMWSPKIRTKIVPEANSVPPANLYKPCISALAASTDSVDSDCSFHSTEDVTQAARMRNNCVVVLTIDELTVSALSSSGEQKIKGQKVALGIVVGMEEEKKSVIFLNGDKASFHHAKDVIISDNLFNDAVSTLNLTFEIHKVAKDFKKIKIAIGIEEAALYKTEVDTFKSFWNFINVTDEEVIGYVPPAITTELHISLLKGAVVIDPGDMRPALINFDHVYLTSMVVEANRDTLLRIILEEGSIYFSKTMKKSMSQQRSLRDYVCVLDSGLTDLSITIKDEGRIELKVSNNVINMRVCSDSLSALCHLIMHLASPASANSTSSQESLEMIQEHQFTDSIHSESCKGLDDREEDLLKDAIDECSTDEQDNDSLKSCENCDAAIRQAIDESGFWILGDDDVGTGITASAEPVARKLINDPIYIKENHFTSTRSRPLPEILKETTQRFLLEQLTIICNFYGGKDFNDEVYDSNLDLLREAAAEKDTDDFPVAGKSSTRKDTEFSKGLRVTFKDDPECEPQVNLWESLNLVSGLEFDSSPKGASNHMTGGAAGAKVGKNVAMEGGKGRQNDVCVQLYLSKIKSLFETFDPTFHVSWRFVFMVQDIEVKDKVSYSRINKMLYEYCNESMPRRNHVNMISIKATCKKNPDDNNDECDIRVSAKPLRINIDQDTLKFLIDFFASISPNDRTPGSSSGSGSFPHQQSSSSQAVNASQTSLDRISVNDTCNATATGTCGSRGGGGDEDEESEAGDAVSNMVPSVQSPRGSRKGSVSSVSRPPLLFVKTFIFSPDVPIRLDYHGKRLDFEKGALAGILMGLGQLNQSELRLKRLYNKHGILGIDRVLVYAIQEWTRDIKRHQLPSLLGGVGPMHSVIQLFQGIKDLVWMPIDQYRRDKRLVRGLQRGASSFSSSTAMALIDLTNRSVNLIQNFAQFAHDVVSVPHPIRGHHIQYSSNNHLSNSQPRDLREGMTTAYAVMKDGLKDGFKENFKHVTQAEDVTGAIGAVVRELPSGIFLPFIHLTQASSNVLVGIRNQLAPDARKEDQDKYKISANDR